MGMLYEIIRRSYEHSDDHAGGKNGSEMEAGKEADQIVESIVRKSHQEAEKKLRAYYAEED